MVNAALHLQPPSNVHPFPRNAGGSGIVGQIVEYGQMLWSPDGTQLIVTFDVPVLTSNPADGDSLITTAVKTSGVLRTDLAGKVTHVVSRDVRRIARRHLARGISIRGRTPPMQGPPALRLGARRAAARPQLHLERERRQRDATTGADARTGDCAERATVDHRRYADGRVLQHLATGANFYGLVLQQRSGDARSCDVPLRAPLFSWSPDGRFSADAPLSGLLETGAAPDAATLQQRYGNLNTLAVLPDTR